MSETHRLLCRMKAYIQPFERILALKELQALTATEPTPLQPGSEAPTLFQVTTNHSAEYLASRLAYWEHVSLLGQESCAAVYTIQVRREATTQLIRNGTRPRDLAEHLPFSFEVPVPGHRNLRYGPHGIHEYRGKFFPQLVRSILNITGLGSGCQVLDPMCGSGTTIVEAILLGCRAIGIDVNPLSVAMSKAKCDILSVDPDRLLEEYEALREHILGLPSHNGNELSWFQHLAAKDRRYLSRWFAPHVLAQLDPITVRVHETTEPACRALFRMSLSNVLRPVSWQKVDDLRVRKDKESAADADVHATFLDELDRSVSTVLAFLYENHGNHLGRPTIIEDDIRRYSTPKSSFRNAIDVIITSPPYATALPYIDTDRLSLCYLDLLPRAQHRTREREMIGNREITNGERQEYWGEYQRRKLELPCQIVDVIDQIDALNRNADVGFRRKNKAALLARYFLDMRQVLLHCKDLLRSGAPAYIVVGNNYTIAGGERIDIETDKLLALLGQSIGLIMGEVIGMDMLVSRDIFRKNTGTAETILVFRKPQS